MANCMSVKGLRSLSPQLQVASAWMLSLKLNILISLVLNCHHCALVGLHSRAGLLTRSTCSYVRVRPLCPAFQWPEVKYLQRSQVA